MTLFSPARRLTVGIPLKYQEDWIAGVYYATNIVAALNRLPFWQKPNVALIGTDRRALAYLRSETRYPRLHQIHPGAITRIPKQDFTPKELRRRRKRGEEPDYLDVILLGTILSDFVGVPERSVLWVPDFQDKNFPQFFAPAELETRERIYRELFAVHRHVMVSSHAVAADLSRYYAGYDNQVHVVPFASFINRWRAQANSWAARRKHGLPRRYFMCPNQLWQHKNHAVVIRALSLLAPERQIPPVVFTGKESDYRNPDYAPGLKALPGQLGVEHRVRFLGFLPRDEQLGLLAGATAVIQPSLSEGWSTVIEDAKACARFILASDTPVHREQLTKNVAFFDPHDPERLAELIGKYAAARPKVRWANYARSRRQFARTLYRLITDVAQDLSDRKMDELTI